MKKICVFIVSLLVFLGNAEAYTSISFAKTRGSSGGWSGGSGTIHSCDILVSPKGLYSEISVTIELSALGVSNVNSGDTLEANINFDLPDKSFIIDSWLWVNDTEIVQADHMGRSTAVSIYNNIVNNIRRDPSLLTKNYYSYSGTNSYNLKIYPFFGLQKRKFRLTYLVPISTGEVQSSIDLPFYLLKPTYSYYNTTSVTYPNTTLKILGISGSNTVDLSIATTNFSGFQTTGNTKLTTIASSFLNSYNSPYSVSDNNVKLVINKNTSPGVELYYTPTSTNSGYFEATILPEKITSIKSTSRICIVIDQDSVNFSYPLKTILPQIRSSLASKYDSTHYFNVIYYKNGIQRFSNTWKKITTSNLSSAFDDSTKFRSDTSRSEPIIANAIDFINSQDSVGYIFVLTSNRSYYSNNDTSKAIATRVINRMTKRTSIDIVNHVIQQKPVYYTSYNYNSNYTSYTTSLGVYFTYNFGNSQLYSYISSLAYGESANYSSYNKTYIKQYPSDSWYVSAYDRDKITFSANLDKFLSKYLGKIIESLDIVFAPQNGFSYQKYYFLGAESASYTNSKSMVSLVGKYVGTFPMQVNVIYTYKGVQQIIPYTINQSQATLDSSIVATHWNGNYIAKNENSTDRNVIVGVTTTALKHRILTKNTAMLALEPSLGGKICTTCDPNQPFTNVFYQNYVRTIGDSISRAYAQSQIITNNTPSITALPSDNETSIQEVEFTAYPNPASERLTFTIKNPNLANGEIEIYDVAGKLVFTKEIVGENIQDQWEWNLIDGQGNRIPAGFYVAILKLNGKLYRVKLIVN